MSEQDIITGTADEMSTELVAAPPTTLFRTDDPVEVLQKATAIAEALKQVLVEKNMIARIGGKEHVQVEGWQTLGAMLGVVPVITWTRKIKRGWEARCEARTLDERVVGAGEAQCLKDETNWKDSDDFAIRSMAQTRATSKALSGPLRFVVTLAGYAATPAEEMHGVNRSRTGSGQRLTSDKQRALIEKLVKEKKATVEQLQIVLDRIGSDVKVETGWVGKLSGGREGSASALITFLKGNPLPSVEHPSDVPGAEPGEFEHPDEKPLELLG